MSFVSRWKSWWAIPLEMRRLLIEATAELLRARLVVALWLKRALPSLLQPRASADALPPLQLQRDIRYILAIAAHTVPWKSLCLPNAIAAKRMLARRGYRSTLRLGVGHTSEGNPHAHAWLEAGGDPIVGEEGMDRITPLPAIALQAEQR